MSVVVEFISSSLLWLSVVLNSWLVVVNGISRLIVSMVFGIV